jgi:hypothetical protein
VTDPAVEVAIIGAVATALSTLAVVAAATLAGIRDRQRLFSEGVASGLRERIALRDEQIRELKADLDDCRDRVRGAAGTPPAGGTAHLTD